MIVGSILLAFGIQAWWDGRQEREEERAILLGLQSDFEQIDRQLMASTEVAESIVWSIDFLLSLEGKGAHEIPLAATDSAMRRLIQSPVLEPGEATLEGLLGSGQLDLIQDRALRESLSAWRSQLESVNNSQWVVRDFIRESLIPYLAREGVPLARAYESGVVGAEEGTVIGGIPSAEQAGSAAEAYARALSSSEFRGLVTYRRSWAGLGVSQLGATLAQARRILGLLGSTGI